MSLYEIMKWVFIICICSLIVNGIIYFNTGNGAQLLSIFGALGLGVIAGITMLKTRKK
ncbi:hypothetical protein [Paenibacillus sp.]|uniref:hypothetical protein n=1 Tax=Paenibacillus sp. TaxID=58172 RepID=UPI00282A1C85|nr:hypothetical protein [Paenibacillus sp.]MDR0270458.1 hypothetical protein [Paenibacillus sp.]